MSAPTTSTGDPGSTDAAQPAAAPRTNRAFRARQVPRPGSVGPRHARTAQPQRADEEGRRRAERAAPHHRHLLQGRLRLDRRLRPARPDALDGPLHPAPSRYQRRQDRAARTRRARRPLLHDAHPNSRRPAQRVAAASDREHRHHVRPRPRRRHRPAERPAALDPDRRRTGDLGRARSGRSAHARSLRRQSAQRARLPGRRRRRRRDRRSDAAHPGDRPPLRGRSRRSRTCPASSRPRSPAAARSARSTRSTTSRSSASSVPTARPASTCGSAAACRPTR